MVSLAQVWHVKATSDDVVSREFGAQHCGAHSPTKEWPGPQGAAISKAFAALGYAVGTTATAVQSYPRLLEVYPHTALLTLMRLLLRSQQKR
jgi:predicted RNase H-like nuclease